MTVSGFAAVVVVVLPPTAAPTTAPAAAGAPLESSSVVAAGAVTVFVCVVVLVFAGAVCVAVCVTVSVLVMVSVLVTVSVDVVGVAVSVEVSPPGSSGLVLVVASDVLAGGLVVALAERLAQAAGDAAGLLTCSTARHDQGDQEQRRHEPQVHPDTASTRPVDHRRDGSPRPVGLQ